LENLYLQPAKNCRSIQESLLFHAIADRPPGPFVVTVLPAAPGALHHLVCRLSFDTWRHVGIDGLSSFASPPDGLPG